MDKFEDSETLEEETSIIAELEEVATLDEDLTTAKEFETMLDEEGNFSQPSDEDSGETELQDAVTKVSTSNRVHLPSSQT